MFERQERNKSKKKKKLCYFRDFKNFNLHKSCTSRSCAKQKISRFELRLKHLHIKMAIIIWRTSGIKFQCVDQTCSQNFLDTICHNLNNIFIRNLFAISFNESLHQRRAKIRENLNLDLPKKKKVLLLLFLFSSFAGLS